MRYTFIILILFLTTIYQGVSATYTSAQAGDFNNINTWVGGTVPTSVDDVIIEHNVYVGFNTTINDVTINSGGILRSNAVSVNLTMTGDLDVQVGGEFRGVHLVVNNLNLVFTGTSVFTNNGTASFKNLTVNGTLTLNSSIGGALLNTSSININGTLNCQANTISVPALSALTFWGGSTLRLDNAGGVDATISGLGTITYNVGANYYFDSNVTDTGFGTITNAKDLTFDGCTIGTTTSLTISGTLFKGVSNGYIQDFNTSNTFTFTGNIAGNDVRLGIGNLKIENNYSNFGRLRVAANLEVDPGVTFGLNTSNDFLLSNGGKIINNGTITAGRFRALGTASIEGTGNTQVQTINDDGSTVSQTSGTFTVAGTTSIESGNVFNFNHLNVSGNLTLNEDIVVESDLNVTGTISSSANQLDLQNGGNTISGGGTIDLDDLIINGGTTLSSTDLIVNDITLNAGTFDIEDNYLRIDNNITNSGGNIDATDNDCEVRFTGSAVDITIPANSFFSNAFGNLTLNKNAKITASNNYTVNNVFSMFNAGLTFDLLNYNFIINGTITYSNGDFDATDDASTITIGGTGALSLPPFLNSEVGNLSLTRNGTITLSNNLTVDGTLTLNNAGLVFDVQTNTLTINNSIVSTNGAIDLTDDASTIDFAFTGATSFSNGAFLSGEVGNMSITGASTITLGSNADIDGAFTLNNASAIFDIDAYRFRLGGNLNYTAGTIDGTDASSTLSFAGTNPINYNAGAFVNFGTIGNLELLQSSTITQVGEVNITNDLFVNNASLYYDAQANVLNLSGDIDYTAGILDFTDVNSEFKITGGNPFTLDGDNFVNNQLGNFRIERNDLVTLSSDLEILNTIYLSNPNMDLDIQTNNIRLILYNNIDNQNPGATTINCETAGTFEFAGSTALELDGEDFLNNSIYNLDLDNSSTITLADDLTIKNNLRMSASAPTIDIVDNDFIIEGNISYFAGEIDATNDLGQFTVAGTGAFSMPTYFVDDEVSMLLISRNGTVTQNGTIDVDANFTLNNAGAIYDLNSNTLTIEDNFTPTSGQIDAQDNGSAFVIANGVTTTAYSGDDFVNNTINELYVYNGVILNDDFVIEDLVNIENSNANFQGTNVEIQGDVTLDNSGGIQTSLTNSMTFSNTTNLTNNSNGSIFLNNIYATGTLNCTASPNIVGNFDVSGVGNFTSGTVTFNNSASKTITNTGTLDFNYVNIASGSDVRTSSNFDLNNDFRMADNTAVFVATSPSEINFTQNNMQIFAETNSDGSSAGLTFFSVNFGNSLNIYFRGAYDFYMNGSYISNNSRVYFEDNSHLYLTSSSPSTPFFSYLTVYDLTFTSSANFTSYNVLTTLNNSLNIDAGANLRTNAAMNVNSESVVVNNTAPNTASNLNIRYVDLTSGTWTTTDSFIMRQNITVDANSVFNQTSGTFSKDDGSITNNGSMTINEFEIIGNATTSSGFQVDGNYYLQNGADSFTASAGSISFTNPNLVIENAGTTQFFDLYLDDAVTNGTTDDDFTIAGDLELGASALFTASSPSEITLSGTGTLNCPTSAIGGSVGLFFHDVDFTGNYTTNSPGSNQVLFEVTGSMNVDGSLDSDTNTEIIFRGGGAETITNNGTLDFNTVTIATGDYSTVSNFNINNLFSLDAGTTFEASAGTIFLTGTSSSISTSIADMADFTFHDLEVNASDAYASGSFTIASDITVNNSSSFTHSTGEIRFVDGGTHTIYNSDQLIFNDFSIEDNNLVQTSSDFTVKSDQFDLLGASSSFNALDGEVSFVVNSSSSTITSGGGLGSVIFHDLLIDDAKSLYIEEDLDIIVQGDFTAGLAANLYTSGNTNFYFEGGVQQTISVENGSEINFQHLTLDNSTGLKLDEDIAVDELNVYKNLTLTDGDLDLFGANILTLQEPDAYLYETGGVVTNSIDDDSQLGHLYYDYTFNATLNTINFAGLGIGFRQGSGGNVFGQTILKRYHTSLLVSGGTSIKRAFSIETANDGLLARPIISYYDDELNDQPEDSLLLSSTRTKDDLWAAIDTKNMYQVNRLESLDTIDQFSDFNTLWTAVVPLRVTLTELEEKVNQGDYPNNRLIAGTTDHNILSFQVSATDFTEITDLKIYLTDNQHQFQNFKLYISQDEFFNSTNDNELIATVQYGIDSLEYNNLTNIEIEPSSPINFFLTADISDSVTIFADSVLVFINQSGITISQGIIDLETVGDVNYKFQQRIDAIFNPIGLEENPLLPNSLDNVIYGFEIQPLGNEAGFLGFDFYFENSPLNAISGNLNLYRSMDNDFNTSDDNTLLDLSSELSITNSQLYTFAIDEEEIVEEEGRYYFIVADSISNFANDGTLDMIMGIPHQSLRSTRAAPIETDTIFGLDYTFSDLDVQLTTSTYISNGTIYKSGRKQNLFGFTLDAENTAELLELIVEFTTTGNLLPSQHFSNIKLWQDLNDNKVADGDELITTGEINSNLFVFDDFSRTVRFSGTRSFIITADIRNDIPINSTITINIPNEDYLIFQSPAKVEAGGPFIGATRTVKVANPPASMLIETIYPSFIQSGDLLDVTIKLLDSEGNETIADDRYDISLNAIGDVTKLGVSNGTIVEGESFKTISGYILTNDDGESPVYITASHSTLPNANSNTFTVFPPGPVNNSSNLTLNSGNPAISSISVDSWTNGSGDGRIIVARLGRTPANPTNGVNYTAENNAIESTIEDNQTEAGSFVIYNGTSTSNQFSFTGLMAGANYYFKVFEYKLFNGQPIYLINDQNPTYLHQTQSADDPYTDNAISDNAVTVYENIEIDGVLSSDDDIDWYKFTKNNDNILINSCGEFLYIDLFQYNENTNELKLVRRTQNTGQNCQIIILNGNELEDYYIKIHRLREVEETNYQFKIRSFNYELFSRPDCDCP